jgi:putative ABC transport system substrate-binding protein
MRPLPLCLALALSVLVASMAEDSLAASGPQRVGIIHHGGEWLSFVDGLRQGLHAAGIEEGKHVVLEIRETKGDLQAVEAAAKELERARVDVIVTASTSVSMGAKRATTQVPIVFFAGSDPVAAGLVESFARPGGRLSGVHGLTRDLTAKRLELLKHLLPKLSRVISIFNPDNRSTQLALPLARGAARKMSLQLVERHARTVDELRGVVQTISPQEFDAFFQITDAMVTAGALVVIEAAREKRLPTMFHETSLCDKGGLFCYGQNYREVGRVAAKFVQRVLAGTAPRDLPVENWDKIELVVNRRTARQIGVAIPSGMLLRADRAIE